MYTLEKSAEAGRAASPGAKAILLAVAQGSYYAAFLRRILECGRWQIETARTCRDAIRAMPRLHPDVILCERLLPDGDWRDLLRAANLADRPARLIVASRLADETLWAEVLNLGGYDVLLEPFHPEEVSRVVENCHPSWSPCRSRIQ